MSAQKWLQASTMRNKVDGRLRHLLIEDIGEVPSLRQVLEEALPSLPISREAQI